MIACVDVDYRGVDAIAACVVFDSWTAEKSVNEIVKRIGEVQPYEPGQFYKRELPCILAVLKKVQQPFNTIIVDGYVWLRDGQEPGLGAKLYESLNEAVPVIGVAKTRFTRGAKAAAVYRGRSQRPLFVTAAGTSAKMAARNIERMHGRFRIPTMLKKADRLCREKQGTFSC